MTGFPKMKKTAQALYSRVLRDTVKSHTARSMELSGSLMSNVEQVERNVVFSPLSLQMLLSLTAAGSNGRTQDQMLRFLNSKSKEQLCSFSSYLMSSVLFDGASIGGPHLCFSNGVWVDKSVILKPSFKHVVNNFYKADLEQLDFRTEPDEVSDQVNSWAEKKTNGLIKKILPTGMVNPLTRLVLANALYFKGMWNKKFDASTTKDYDFHLLDGGSVHVPS
ncbi:serpin-ZX-like [Tripterygium wilfordii]|uniref:Serpin-ZX-like n=1 Tax=Tripterygium wilfordii TaxID=458696 RepID=A0A7J7C5P4_TRIWF|nr:serpin-ZX-like [Tripterygium wilfordii]